MKIGASRPAREATCRPPQRGKPKTQVKRIRHSRSRLGKFDCALLLRWLCVARLARSPLKQRDFLALFCNTTWQYLPFRRACNLSLKSRSQPWRVDQVHFSKKHALQIQAQIHPDPFACRARSVPGRALSLDLCFGRGPAHLWPNPRRGRAGCSFGRATFRSGSHVRSTDRSAPWRISFSFWSRNISVNGTAIP